jgi:general stress protein 26
MTPVRESALISYWQRLSRREGQRERGRAGVRLRHAVCTRHHMAKEAREQEDGKQLGTAKKLDQLYELIDGIEIAMMTTRTKDGTLVSRPMQTQARRAGTDLWFMTSVDAGKVDEIIADPQVNLGYYKDGSREYVSVSGRAHITQDKAIIHQLYKPDWKAWLGDEGGERNGGPDDPRIALIEVIADSAYYLKSTQPRLIALFSVAKSIVTGNPPQIGDMGQLSRADLAQGDGVSRR